MEREKEKEKQDRIQRAQKQKKETIEKIKRKETQTKITEKLAEIPGNRRKIIEMKIEKERLMELKEGKLKLWNKWRQNKGGKTCFPKFKEKKSQGNLEEKLKKIEKEIEKYREELKKEGEEKR